MTKTTDELIKEFLDNGGEIEVLEPIEVENRYIIGSTVKKAPELMTLGEGEDMFGKKQKRKKSKKEPDYSGINLDLIPKHLHNIIKKPVNNEQDSDKGEATDETN